MTWIPRRLVLVLSVAGIAAVVLRSRGKSAIHAHDGGWRHVSLSQSERCKKQPGF